MRFGQVTTRRRQPWRSPRISLDYLAFRQLAESQLHRSVTIGFSSANLGQPRSFNHLDNGDGNKLSVVPGAWVIPVYDPTLEANALLSLLYPSLQRSRYSHRLAVPDTQRIPPRQVWGQ